MADVYDQLLDATIQHLEGLKARGVRFVPVSPDSLATLQEPLPRIAPVPKAPAASQPAAPQITPKPRSAPPATPIVAPAVDPERASREASLQKLRERVLACVQCANLAAARKNVVFGVGNPCADLMFVGEAPGADEDIAGEPFVGKAGQLLTKIIQTMGLSREQVYIANILKCRPDTPGQTAGNRKPMPEEMATCIPYLQEQIAIIRPKVLVGLGGTAIEGLLGRTVAITKFRGNWRSYRDIPLMPTYHPAYLLRNQSLALKREIWEDMLQVMEKLGLPISEKQRSYFLKPG